MRVFWILLSFAITISGILVFLPEEERMQEALPTGASIDRSEATRSPADAETRPRERAERTPANNLNENLAGSESSPSDSEIEYADAPGADLSGVLQTIENMSSENNIDEAPEMNADEIIAELNIDGAADELPVADESLATEASTADTETEEVTTWDELLEKVEEKKSAEAVETASSENTVETAPAPAEASAPAKPLTIARTEDGSLSIGGGKYVITGAGTKTDPYVLPWEFMVSARESYNPREDKKTIPAHISMFDGAYITIAGYLQFPLATPEPTECLVMLNQWDGCCIGVPPTPYDAIEVSLSEAAGREQKFAVEGRVVGKLKIDPYLVGNWLIGLYLMEDASVDTSGSRSAEEVYGNTPSQFIPPVE